MICWKLYTLHIFPNLKNSVESPEEGAKKNCKSWLDGVANEVVIYKMHLELQSHTTCTNEMECFLETIDILLPTGNPLAPLPSHCRRIAKAKDAKVITLFVNVDASVQKTL